MTIPTAKLKYARVSPRKARLVADIVRGLPVKEARAQLMLAARRPGAFILKLLNSSLANAEHTGKLNPDHLFIKTIKVDQAPALKRWMPRARGAMNRIEKRASHISIELGVSEKIKPSGCIFPAKKKEGEGKEARRLMRKAERDGRTRLSRREEAKPRPEDMTKEASKPRLKVKPDFKRFFRRKSI